MTEEQKKPDNLVFESRLDSIRLSIWENRDKSGKSFHTVNIVRRYKTGDEWSSSSHYIGLAQVTLLKRAAEIAEQFLTNRELGR